MTFQNIEESLASVTEKTYRRIAPEGEEEPYVVWDHDGQSDSLHGNGKMTNQVIEGTIDLFTKMDDDPLFDKIQQTLNNAEICFFYNSKQEDEATGIIHHEWVWNIEMEV